MRSWSFTCFSLVLAFFQSSIPELRGGVEFNVAVEQGTTIHINTSSSTNTQCKICMRLQNQRLCQPYMVLRSDTLLDFTCSQPEKAFIVQITREIGKMTIEPKDHSTFLQFNRTFIWNLKPLTSRSLQLSFSSTGLRQIEPTESCPDKHRYMLTVENFSVGKFCQNGAIRQIDIRNSGKLSVEVTGGQRLDMKIIDVSVGRFMNSLVNIQVVLPEKSSNQDFITPKTIPENAEIMWNFSLPNAYYTDVRILKTTVPTCLQPESIPTMKYTWQGRDPLVKHMNEIQPSVEPGNFSLSIKNCKLSNPASQSQRLMVHFQISAIKRTKGQCEGDLPDKQVLQIRVVKKDPKSVCVLKLDSVIMDTVTIASGNHFILNTFDCNKDELELTVNHTVECKEWRSCASTPFPLTFYYEQQCIQGVLKTITWLLHGPVSSAVELQSPADGLRYCLPEDQCNSILQLNVSHVINPDTTVGQFSPKGSIQKIQIRDSKIAVTASVSSFSDKSLATKPFLNYSFIQGISESYTFTVAPKMDYPTLLASPAWPFAMKPSSTVSWIVNVEPQFRSTLKFRNVSQPKCKELHTNIAVRTIHSQTLMYSNMQNDKIPDLPVPESFYLNMTNCKSPTGAFRAMMEITVQSNTNKLLGVILGVVGAALVIIAAVVIWFIVRKKKRKKAPAVSVYNPCEHAFLPGLHGIPKTQEDDEDPHTYAYIDDTLVYSHLLNADCFNKPHKEDIRDDGNKPPLPDRPNRKVEDHTKDNELLHSDLNGYVQGQSTKTSVKSSEEGTYETRIFV